MLLPSALTATFSFVFESLINQQQFFDEPERSLQLSANQLRLGLSGGVIQANPNR